MELVVMFSAVLLGLGLAYAIGASLWMRFRWEVLGWKPVILNEEIVSRTVAECAPSAVNDLGGQAVSDEEKLQRVKRLEWLFREVILRYARNYAKHV
jgi:hypothetical protein